MTAALRPFPYFHHPPFGVVDKLPYCRDGVRDLPADLLRKYQGPTFPELWMQRHLNGARSRGICGLLPAAAFTDGTVRPHEATLESRLLRQEELVLADRGALGKPVLITAPDLTDWWARQDRTHHATGRDVNFAGQDNDYRLRSLEPRDGRPAAPLSLANVGQLCIADGHHRAATHARLAARGVEACTFIPVCLVGAEDLHIGTFLRIIDAPLSADILPGLRPFFTLTPLEAALGPERVGEWLLVYGGAFYRLTRKLPAPAKTDVGWLDEVVLPQVFGIENTRTDPRITFDPIPDVPGGALEYDWSPEKIYLCGFPLPPARFFAEVAAGNILPPKSTRFEPRVPSGMVVWMP